MTDTEKITNYIKSLPHTYVGSGVYDVSNLDIAELEALIKEVRVEELEEMQKYINEMGWLSPRDCEATKQYLDTKIKSLKEETHKNEV